MAYIGQKMSERAAIAYENGEKPLSKWSKSEIVELVLEKRNDFEEKELNKYNKESLKAFLTYSSWHHTGSYFNNTDFYSLDEDFIELSKEEIVEVLNNRMNETKKAKEEKKKKNFKNASSLMLNGKALANIQKQLIVKLMESSRVIGFIQNMERNH